MWFSILLMNTAPVACLTLLALHFDKWWIVLFAILFSFSYKSTHKEDEK